VIEPDDKIVITICPHCEGVSNYQTPVGGKPDRPVTGDASVCGGCGEVSIFDFATPNNLRLPTESEQAEIAAHPGISEARAIVASRDL
jgi:hypothetical protein